jgi:hypothetical protein
MTALKVTTIRTTAGIEVYLAKVWVNLNGTGTVAIRSSGNTSSITDGGVGLYTVNFAVAQPDGSISYHGSYSGEVNVQVGIGFAASVGLTTSMAVVHYNPANSVNTVDKAFVTITIYR